MTIDPKQQIAGCSLLRIRDFLRRYSNREFDLLLVARALDLDEIKAAAILEWLEQEKYIERVASAVTEHCWTGTNQASVLANASARKRISRATADRLLRELIERATQVNHAREFAYYVSRVVVWGSYLGTAATLGDLDVTVELRAVEHDARLQQQLEEKRIRAAYASERAPRTVIEQVYLPRHEVIRFLKGRSRSYHFVPCDDRVFRQAPQRIVFEADVASRHEASP